MWKISLARYSKKLDAVAERTVKTFAQGEHDKALTWLNAHGEKPLILWHIDSVHLDYPLMAQVLTDTYKAEYRKIQMY